LESFDLHRSALGLRTSPWKEPRPRNVVLGGFGRRGSPDSGEVVGGLGRGSGWGGSRVRLGPIWVLTCGGEMTGGMAAEQGGGRRWSSGSDEPVVRPGQQAGVGAPVDPSEAS
jgi:hypothetical protein